jgi:quaternary ammonium compound-resistance protein SugE
MAWTLLFIAGLFEIGWVIGLKYTDGFTRPAPSVATVAAMVASFILLAQAVRTLPLGTAYAVWTGIGTVGAVLLAMWLFGEPTTPLRLFFMAMILGGIIGLKAITP